MAQIKLRDNLENIYKVKTLVIISFILTFLLENHYIKFLSDPALSAKFNTFFNNGSLLSLYGTLIGLLLTAYSLIVTIIPLFSADSLQKPIFSQINSLFVFTILDGILLLIIFFAGGLIPDNSSFLFLDSEIFFFLCFLIGLIFCVLTLSDLFRIIRRRGVRR
ncbi:MAG: hypothetical protein M1304_04160 [Candidatus Thermoplasmatota archaeon]|nr:hypothetical protein [Candidatus Thermoplasmatota archaeon]MCL5732988.1 hypothetical protein [Candidatus Thermoplasmatota archaeon]MCL5882084.1 hypothetical protein [Candidatus Thermoplasmatota archaeon]